MRHGRLSPEVAKGLLLLQKRIREEDIPSSKIDETLLVATWNIRELGKKRRLGASLHYIAEVNLTPWVLPYVSRRPPSTSGSPTRALADWPRS